MTVQIAKTKAEQGLLEQFERALPRLPGAGWVKDARKQAIGAFAALGLPHRRIEAWKYTDLRAALKEALPPARADGPVLDEQVLAAALGPELATLECIEIVFVDGAFVKARMRPADGAAAYSFDTLARTLGQPGFEWMKSHFLPDGRASSEAMLALNAAFASDGAVLRIADGAAIPVPIHLVFLSQSDMPQSTAIRNLIEVGRDARVVLLESHVGSGASASQSNAVTEIAVRDRAQVEHIKLTAHGPRATHIGTWIVRIGAGATYRAFQMTADTGLVRNQLDVAFLGEGAKLDISGVFLARGAEHIDTTLVVDHAVPACVSRELFKGVLDGRARGIFQGKVIVRPDAQKSDGKQMAQVLMLSPDAEFDSKPELEIYADDVVCGHGSTAAELDDDLVFYCRSRGIPLAQARALLIESFVGEALEKIAPETVRAALAARSSRWLAGLGVENERPAA